jgi:signal transduction histidine kinase/HAMP domain-containing protein
VSSNRVKMRLRTKIIAWSFIPTAIILLLVALTTYRAYQQVTEEVVITRDEELTRLSASELSSGFEEYVDRLTTVTRSFENELDDPVKVQSALSAHRNRLVFFDSGVILLNHRGTVVATLPEQPELIGNDWSYRSYFIKMIRSPSVVFSNIEPSSVNREDVIVIAIPILNADEEFRGVALGIFRLRATAVSPFYGTIIKQRIGRSGNAFVVDGNNRLIYASDLNLIGRSFSYHPVTSHALPGRVGAIRTQTIDGRDIVAGYAPVPRSDWTLVVEEDWNDLIQSSRGYQQFLVFLLMLGVLIPTVVVMIGVQRITGPVSAFTTAAQNIADGDFNQPIQIETHDELEELADHFNAMAQHLRESYETLEQRVEMRTRELTALNSVAGVVSRSLDLEKILPDALDKTIEVMGMDGGAIFRVEEETQTLNLVVQRGLDPDFVALIRRYSIENSVVKDMVETQQPTARFVTDYEPGPIRSSLERGGWVTIVGIPLVAQKKMLGAINLGSHSRVELTRESLAVPAAIGQQIGVAIDNARLYAQTLEYARQMEVARELAERANTAKSDFLANVSHELRTPLVSITGFAHIVQKRLEERIFSLMPSGNGKTQKAIEQINENLRIILIEGQRLTTLINNLLDLEKIEAGKMEWHKQPIVLSEVINQVCVSTAALFYGKELELLSEIPNEIPMVLGDRDKLQQLLINLIANAVKFTERGTVTIQVKQVKDEIQINVIDTGIGIAPEYQPLLFDKFIQVGDPMTAKPKGTGLGLTISKEIVEHHGGRIWISSEPGKGSTFSFTIPIYHDHE